MKEDTICTLVTQEWANATTGWLKLADYGDWPHPRGIQRLSRQAAATMCEYFKSLRGRLARRFGGLPVYIGHPDDPGFAGQSGHGDTRAYAWISDMQDRDDGLYVLPRWSQAGRELLGNAVYKFLSPRWGMRHLEGDLYEPVRLISIGLTNQPNIPGEAIANASTYPTSDTFTDDSSNCTVNLNEQDTRPVEALDILDLLGVNPEGDWRSACLEMAANARRWVQEGENLSSDSEELSNENERFYRLANEHEKAREQAEENFANERRARISLLIDHALLRGRILPHERESWESGLEADFEGGLRDLCNTRFALHTQPRTGALGSRAPLVRKRRDFLALVNERVDSTGEDFTTAWSAMKRDRPELYDQLNFI
ncbi:MAG: phage protease [Puniceicoccales bacterium]